MLKGVGFTNIVVIQLQDLSPELTAAIVSNTGPLFAPLQRVCAVEGTLAWTAHSMSAEQSFLFFDEELTSTPLRHNTGQ